MPQTSTNGTESTKRSPSIPNCTQDLGAWLRPAALLATCCKRKASQLYNLPVHSSLHMHTHAHMYIYIYTHLAHTHLIYPHTSPPCNELQWHGPSGSPIWLCQGVMATVLSLGWASSQESTPGSLALHLWTLHSTQLRGSIQSPPNV